MFVSSFIQTMILRVLLATCLIINIQSELLQVFSLTRHGARYPINSLFDGSDLFGMWGQLTSVGMRQHHTLGSKLRQQYVNNRKFIDASFNHSQIEAYSTVYNRAIVSLISFMAGFYPAGTGQNVPAVSSSLLTPPYKYSDDISSNASLPNNRQLMQFREDTKIFINCDPQIDVNIANFHATIDEMNIRYQPLIDRVKTLLSITQPINSVNLSSALDTVLADIYLNRPTPINSEDLANMRHLHYFSNLLKMSANYSRSMNTPKWKHLFSRFDNRLKNKQQPLKWTFLSGHDTDIYPFLIDLNISSSQCIEQLYRFNKTNALNCEPGPEFTSSLLFQLHSINGTNQIMVKYNGKYAYLCELKQTSCNYDEFKRRVTRNYVDYESLCSKK